MSATANEPVSPHEAAPAEATQPPPLWPMYRAVVGIGIVCGLLIVTVYELTKPIIAANRARARRQAIFKVLPQATSSTTFVWVDKKFERVDGEPKSGQPTVYAGYDGSGSLVGFAIEAAGMGYQDLITVLYGYSPAVNGIIGVRVLESRETPGLGDKIEKDPAFLANFERLDVSLSKDGTALAHPITAVKHGKKTSPWQIDAITGATISSFAIGDILRSSAGKWVPRLAPRLEQFKGGGATAE